MENYFEDMSYNKDFWCMCWDNNFLDKEVIKTNCHCPDIIKKSCLALCDMMKSKVSEKIIKEYIEIQKENIRSVLYDKRKSKDD